jgi:hypothetical protein
MAIVEQTRQRGNGYNDRLWARYERHLKALRTALTRRTLGSDQRAVDRARRIVQSYDALFAVWRQLKAINRQ